MVTFFFESGIDTVFGKLILLVDLISLIGGVVSYKQKKYKLLLFFILLSVIFQYFGLVF